MPMVRLLDGREVDSTSEHWRHESEARAIAALPTLVERRAWLEQVEQRRGKESADRLRVTMKALWDAKTRSTPTG
ncbi:hypothetical protein UFOVP726_17 [uncultured Caudovirales phage]|uniref:Uncharacterized protein n=1 Tax=uncultured Caudovirales phage TaxID=2100421 RepID=A0A6J5NK86_9CAUD|nr:hypothetical protein UFOVP726_17 [uncultured Caudovirales phage]